MSRSDEFLFRRGEDRAAPATTHPQRKEPWKLLVVDDEEEVHKVTRLVLAGFSYDDRGLEFLHAYSGGEARRMVAEHPDIAVILLDVVMEDYDSGLKLVRHIREELKNKFARIILRTGQPGHAPESRVIVEYDINDYKEKTEITAQKLVTTMVAALRTYRDMLTIEANRKGLERILAAASDIFRLGSLETFVGGVLTQLTSLLNIEGDAFYGQLPFFAATAEDSGFVIRAASGKFEQYVRRHVRDLPEADIRRSVEEALAHRDGSCRDGGHVEYFESKTGSRSLIYFEECRELTELDRKLMEVFFANVSIGFDNIALNQAAEEKARIAEEALRQAERANHEAMLQMARRAESLRKISQAVAHQLRNPMTVIAGFANILRGRPELGPRCAEYLDGIVAAAGRVEKLAAAVREYSDIRLGERRMTEVSGVLAEARARAEQALAGTPRPVAWEVSAGESLRASLDPDLAAQAVAELLVNAVEALPDAGGRVGLRAWESEGFLRIEVSDDGRGIPEAEQAYVLDPFYTTKPVGVGMGLTRAARIAQEHGGTLTLASDPAHGTRAEIVLPLNPDGLPL
ncbi:DUF3369 domain-containing protein [Desulfovibrio aminophilus]|nr:DUF3369 domain-containing protein [Desulfovibrio aminophilus]MCM0755182.1 DUF3369 domain-containing protein [Desulfovibrio aminophilus]